jgi:ABC-type multidrug transport system ATPase subunit/pSer/pThr/pTyr-binding forkhead associated (FHA) protein
MVSNSPTHVCPRCHAVLPGNATFCGDCGLQQVAPTPPGVSPAIFSGRSLAPVQGVPIGWPHYQPQPSAVDASQTLIAPLSALSTPALIVRSDTAGAPSVYQLDQPYISIGRDSANDIVIDDPSFSPYHLQIQRQGQHFVLRHPHPEHPQTTHGLFIQGRKIRGDESFQKVLVGGDLFRIGTQHGSLITLIYHDGNTVQQEASPPLPPIKLNQEEITLGRQPGNTVVLPHPQVSGQHARLVRAGGTYRLLDLRSANGVYVNARRVTNHLLKLGDEIRIGPYRLVYETTQLRQYDESRHIRIDAFNLKKVGSKQATLLNNVSLSIPPHALVAVVGASGVGKSMLLDALSGIRPAHEGKVLYNGQDFYQNLAAFRAQIGYVPQDETVHRNLTVERALYYASKLRLPGDFTEEQIRQRIDEVLEDVELSERRRQSIKKLSGGQRKRVSIALELLANPSLFFLDEPTSGLDPGLDRKMMLLLRKLADQGHTIILVTHATNNISVCDYVCFLAQGGRLAYFGTPDGAKAYFDRTDFAEIYSSLDPTEVHEQIAPEAERRFQLSGEYQQYIVQPLQQAAITPTPPLAVKRGTPLKRGSFWRQWRLLTLRHFELLKNDLPTLLLLLLQAPLIGLLLAGLIHSEFGAHVFEGNTLLRCLPQIRTSADAVLVVPHAPTQDGTVNCDQVRAFLLHPDAHQQVVVQAFVQAKGGVNQALQDFIVAGQAGSAQRFVFMVSLIAVMFGLISASRELVKERAIYQRERAVNLGIVPYMFSKILVFSLLALFQSAALVLILNAFDPLGQGVFLPVLLESYITLALTSIAGGMTGLAISALVPNEDAVSSLLPIAILTQVLLSGVIVPLHGMVTNVLALLVPLRWGMVGFGSTLGLHSDKVGGDTLWVNDSLYHGTLYSIYTQAEATQRIVLTWIVLAVMISLLISVIGVLLKRLDARG